MLNILVDTCVWLDFAKDPEQLPLLSVIEELITCKELRLIVPQIVLDEIARNKERVIQDSGRSMSSAFKRAKEAVTMFADPKRSKQAMELLNDVDHRIPTLGEAVNKTVGRVQRILKAATVIQISSDVKSRAAQRAIDKVAPFHRQRNGIDDSILIEVYADQLNDPAAKGQRFAFVSHNTKDFSDPSGDNRTPHPDLAKLFTPRKSRYYISLSEAVRSVRPELVSELMVHHEEWVQEPRQLSEILEVLDEMVNRIWYDRHCLWVQQVEDGKHKIVDRETFERDRDFHGTTAQDIWDGARKSARRMEQKYGKENLGPYSKFDWGMLNGKVSALRWVLGDEWDMLDT
jgi:hypothetical protein